MNPGDLLEKLQTLELLGANRYPKLKPIHDSIVLELEDYAQAIKAKGEDKPKVVDSEEDGEGEDEAEVKPSKLPPAANVARRA